MLQFLNPIFSETPFRKMDLKTELVRQSLAGMQEIENQFENEGVHSCRPIVIAFIPENNNLMHNHLLMEIGKEKMDDKFISYLL